MDKLFSLDQERGIVPNSHASKNVVAFLKDYQNWDDYRAPEQDFVCSDYYEQSIGLGAVTGTIARKEVRVIDMQPISIGSVKSGYFSKKEWLLDCYPALLVGIEGVESALKSMAEKYAPSGLIYFGCLAGDYKRLSTSTGSIDPINPMAQNTAYFESLFGHMGPIISDVVSSLKREGKLLDVHSVESILMIDNLRMWAKEKRYGARLEEYVSNIDLAQHTTHCQKAYETITLLKTYPQVFKLDASIDISAIVANKEVLVVDLPAIIANLVLAQITYLEREYRGMPGHLQNVIIENFAEFAFEVKNIDFINTRVNYIFTAKNFLHKNQTLFDYILFHAKTHILLKQEDLLPNKVKLDLFNNLEEMPVHIFGKATNYMKHLTNYLRNQAGTEAVILCKNKSKKTGAINSDIRYYTQSLSIS